MNLTAIVARAGILTAQLQMECKRTGVKERVWKSDGTDEPRLKYDPRYPWRAKHPEDSRTAQYRSWSDAMDSCMNPVGRFIDQLLEAQEY